MSNAFISGNTEDIPTVVIPTEYRGNGAAPRKDEAYKLFAEGLQAVQALMSKKASSRGWAYILEEVSGLTKDQFNKAESRVVNARKWGYLSVDFTAMDGSRTPQGNAGINADYELDDELEYMWGRLETALLTYHPDTYQSYQPCYMELLVEKVDLVSMFEDIAQTYRIQVSNGRGDTDLHSIAGIHRRFMAAQARGQECVLLYCGDHDPKGVNISHTIRNRFDESAKQHFADGTRLEPIDFTIDRFGLNLDFIERHKLSKVPNLITGRKTKMKCLDGRTYPPGIVGLDNPIHPDHMKSYVQKYLDLIGRPEQAWKVEANAMIVREKVSLDLFKQTIAKYVDADGIRRYKEAGATAREELGNAFPDFMKTMVAGL